MARRPVPGRDVQDGYRLELKWSLDRQQYRALHQELGRRLSVDRGAARDDAGYRVRSLYFDTPGMACYYDNIDGVLQREKYRLRTYEPQGDGSGEVFLEAKGRSGSWSYKHRTAVTSHQVWHQRTRLGLLSYQDPGNETAMQRLAVARARLGLSAKVLVEYRRQAFQAPYAGGPRITLDRDLRAMASRDLFPATRAWFPVRGPAWSILEVKACGGLPSWFYRLVRTLDLERCSFSKYSASAETLSLARRLQ